MVRGISSDESHAQRLVCNICRIDWTMVMSWASLSQQHGPLQFDFQNTQRLLLVCLHLPGLRHGEKSGMLPDLSQHVRRTFAP